MHLDSGCKKYLSEGSTSTSNNAGVESSKNKQRQQWSNLLAGGGGKGRGKAKDLDKGKSKSKGKGKSRYVAPAVLKHSHPLRRPPTPFLPGLHLRQTSTSQRRT